MEGSGTTLVNIFTAFALIMILLALGVVIFVVIYQRRVMSQQMQLKENEARYQIDLLKASFESQEKERERIAKDLHDEVGAMLSAVKMNLHLVERKLTRQGVEQDLAPSHELIEKTIGSVRQVSHDLMPPSLNRLGLGPALTEFFSKMEVASGVEMTFFSHLTGQQLSGEQELGIFRIVQEVVNNTLKHAEATKITANLSVQDGQLTLTYRDNGKGFDLVQARKAGGLGLMSLESRAKILSGTLELESAPQTGTQIHLQIPLSHG